jgi:hypothetical protein
MSTSDAIPAADPARPPSDDFTKTWRYRVGLALIILGHVAIGVGMLLPLLGLVKKGGAGLVGVLIVGGEITTLASIVFLGMQGFKAIKSKIFGAVKGGYVAPVGRVRYAIGITLFVSSFLTNYLILFYVWTAFRMVAVEDPFPIIWGLDHGGQATLVHWLAVWGEAAFLVSIYVLGAAWWGRFRSLFTIDGA